MEVENLLFVEEHGLQPGCSSPATGGFQETGPHHLKFMATDWRLGRRRSHGPRGFGAEHRTRARARHGGFLPYTLLRCEEQHLRLEAFASKLEAIASRLEAIASRLETIASRLEAIRCSSKLFPATVPSSSPQHARCSHVTPHPIAHHCGLMEVTKEDPKVLITTVTSLQSNSHSPT